MVMIGIGARVFESERQSFVLVKHNRAVKARDGVVFGVGVSRYLVGFTVPVGPGYLGAGGYLNGSRVKAAGPYGDGG